MATAETAAQAADPSRIDQRKPLVIVGSGEHARVVAEAAAARPGTWRLLGYSTPDGEPADAPPGGLSCLGSDPDLAARAAADALWLVLGFGASLGARREAVARFGAGSSWAVVVHPAAIVSPTATIGEGTVVFAGGIVNTGAVVGRHVIVNTGAIVEHDVQVGDFTHLAPAVAIGGGSRIGPGTLVGLGARIRDHISVGAGAVIAMGAVVVADVPDGAVVLGVPARARHQRADA